MAKSPKGADPAAMRNTGGASWPSAQQQATTGVELPLDGGPKSEAEQENAAQRRNAIVTDEALSQGPGSWIGGNTGATPYGTHVDNDEQADDAANARNAVVTAVSGDGIAGPQARGVDPRIYDALSQLDQANDSHWTDEGLPSTAAVQKIASELGRGMVAVNRDTVNKAAPGFTRTAAPFQGPVSDLINQDDDSANKSINELTAGNSELQALEKHLNDAYGKRDELIDYIKSVERKRDRITTRLEQQARDNPKNSFAETRRYLDRQQEERTARATPPAKPARPSAPKARL